MDDEDYASDEDVSSLPQAWSVPPKSEERSCKASRAEDYTSRYNDGYRNLRRKRRKRRRRRRKRRRKL